MSEPMLLNYLAHALRLLFGMHQQKFCSEWDALLNEILGKGEVVDSSNHTLTLRYSGKDYGVWTSNKFYSYGHVYSLNGVHVEPKNHRRPKLKTMLRLSVLRSAVESDEFRRFKATMQP